MTLSSDLRRIADGDAGLNRLERDTIRRAADALEWTPVVDAQGRAGVPITDTEPLTARARSRHNHVLLLDDSGGVTHYMPLPPSPERTREEAEVSEIKMRLDAYYYGFEPTGQDAIDKILSAVACAGKAFHHTESWTDEAIAPNYHTGANPAEWIQSAAVKAAEEVARLRAERDAEREGWEKASAYVEQQTQANAALRAEVDALKARVRYYADALCMGRLIALRDGGTTGAIEPERVGAVIDERDTLRAQLTRLQSEKSAAVEVLRVLWDFHRREWGKCPICQEPYYNDDVDTHAPNCALATAISGGAA